MWAWLWVCLLTATYYGLYTSYGGVGDVGVVSTNMSGSIGWWVLLESLPKMELKLFFFTELPNSILAYCVHHLWTSQSIENNCLKALRLNNNITFAQHIFHPVRITEIISKWIDTFHCHLASSFAGYISVAVRLCACVCVFWFLNLPIVSVSEPIIRRKYKLTPSFAFCTDQSLVYCVGDF